MNPDRLLERISIERITSDLWELVNTPSPTTHEGEAALLFAEMLKGAGMDVEMDHTIPDSPNVIGRLAGSRPGPTLQLAGHLDHIDVPHPSPERKPGVISGRGAADMKSGLAAMLELVRILAESDRSYSGGLLVTAYGLHEAPLGQGQGLYNMIRRGVCGNAALVFEGPPDCAVVCGKGQSIWNLTIRREGDVCHELRRPPNADDPLRVALGLVEELTRENERLKHAEHGFPLLGPESVFIGQMHYGDFYNRAPDTFALQGTWRWHPDKSYDQVRGYLDNLVRQITVPQGSEVESEWTFVGESFSVDPKEAIVQALRSAYRKLKGRDLKLAGVSAILDTSRLVPAGNIPTVPIDFGGDTAHADYEYVALDTVVAGCRLALLTALRYLLPEDQ